MNLPDMVENGGDMYNWQIPAIYRNPVRRNKNLTRLQAANTHIRDITPIAGPGIMALVRAEVTNYDPNFNNTHCRVMLDVDPHDRPPNNNIQVTGLAPQTVSFVWEVDNMALAHHGCLEEPDLEKRQPEENARNAPRRPRRADRAAWAIAPFVFLVHFWRGWSETTRVRAIRGSGFVFSSRRVQIFANRSTI